MRVGSIFYKKDEQHFQSPKNLRVVKTVKEKVSMNQFYDKRNLYGPQIFSYLTKILVIFF